MTHGLEGRCSTPLSYGDIIWSGGRDLNSQQPAWKAGTLPIELHPLKLVSLERIELSLPRPKRGALPLRNRELFGVGAVTCYSHPDT